MRKFKMYLRAFWFIHKNKGNIEGKRQEFIEYALNITRKETDNIRCKLRAN